MQYQRKLLAAAVVGAFTVAPAIVAAQTSSLSMGGQMNIFYAISDPNNGNVGKKGDYLEQSENELWVRGEERLGGGLSMWFQCASSMDTVTATGVGLCTRNSATGFKGSWGNAFVGNWDTPIKSTMNKNRGWFSGTNSLYGGSANLLFGGSGGVGNPVQVIGGSSTTAGTGSALATTMSSKADAFFRRQSQLLSYNSPSWNGFDIKAAYSAANQATGQGGNNLKQRLFSLAGAYENGPMFVNLSFERHMDYNPGNVTVGTAAGQYNGGDDDKWMIGGGYTFTNNFRLSGLYTETKYEPTSTTDLKVKGFGIYADWKVQGPHSLRAMYAKVNDTKGSATGNIGSYKAPIVAGVANTDTGADMYTLAYAYDFSKRTSVGFSYNHLSNDRNANFSQGKTAATLGGNQAIYGLFTNIKF